MPPKKRNLVNDDGKKEESSATQQLSTLFYFGPQPKTKEAESAGYGLISFLEAPQFITKEQGETKKRKQEEISEDRFPKPFGVPYNEHTTTPDNVKHSFMQKAKKNTHSIKIEDDPKYADNDHEELPDKLTLVEERINQVSNIIRNKPQWQEKIHNSTIVEKWMQELQEQSQDTYQRNDTPVTKDMMDYIIGELKSLSSLTKDNIEVSSVTGVWQSDKLISEELLKELKKEVAVLENVPEHQKDWHPDSGSQVLDLVHPSLFCWVNGTTPLYHPEDKNCHVYLVNIDENTNFTRSEAYQWLPSEFHVDNHGKVSILSYINNLDPSVHKPLYNTIGKIFERFVPMFERVLSDLISYGHHLRQDFSQMGEWEEYSKAMSAYESYLDEYGDDEENEENEDNKDEDKPEKPEEPEKPKPRIIEPYREFERTPVSLCGKTLQVIVKLANIELTPESPSYPGGSWHVEGMQNEDIVSSGIYYYESDNITESILNFRKASSLNFGDYDEDGSISSAAREVYGISNNHELNDTLGGLITKSKRAIAFPNVYQHQVAPFELEDKTKKGVRKILVFFLVDPTNRILSTANVPPQQKSWAMRELAPIFHKLPKISYLPMMDLKTAKEHREELMDERRQFVLSSGECIFERLFSLCEH